MIRPPTTGPMATIMMEPMRAADGEAAAGDGRDQHDDEGADERDREVVARPGSARR
jgi:hypothetical protein